MKKLTLSVALALAISASAAGFSGGNSTNANANGGYIGTMQGVNSVAAALDARDDTLVTITGKIVTQVGHEKYEFSDGKKSIIVEIDDEDWGGLTVGPDDLVRIYGEVDSDMFRANEIDVKQITKVSK